MFQNLECSPFVLILSTVKQASYYVCYAMYIAVIFRKNDLALFFIFKISPKIYVCICFSLSLANFFSIVDTTSPKQEGLGVLLFQQNKWNIFQPTSLSSLPLSLLFWLCAVFNSWLAVCVVSQAWLLQLRRFFLPGGVPGANFSKWFYASVSESHSGICNFSAHFLQSAYIQNTLCLCPCSQSFLSFSLSAPREQKAVAVIPFDHEWNFMNDCLSILFQV